MSSLSEVVSHLLSFNLKEEEEEKNLELLGVYLRENQNRIDFVEQHDGISLLRKVFAQHYDCHRSYYLSEVSNKFTKESPATGENENITTSTAVITGSSDNVRTKGDLKLLGLCIRCYANLTYEQPDFIMKLQDDRELLKCIVSGIGVSKEFICGDQLFPLSSSADDADIILMEDNLRKFCCVALCNFTHHDDSIRKKFHELGAIEVLLDEIKRRTISSNSTEITMIPFLLKALDNCTRNFIVMFVLEKNGHEVFLKVLGSLLGKIKLLKAKALEAQELHQEISSILALAEPIMVFLCESISLPLLLEISNSSAFLHWNFSPKSLGKVLQEIFGFLLDAFEKLGLQWRPVDEEDHKWELLSPSMASTILEVFDAAMSIEEGEEENIEGLSATSGGDSNPRSSGFSSTEQQDPSNNNNNNNNDNSSNNNNNNNNRQEMCSVRVALKKTLLDALFVWVTNVSATLSLLQQQQHLMPLLPLISKVAEQQKYQRILVKDWQLLPKLISLELQKEVFEMFKGSRPSSSLSTVTPNNYNTALGHLFKIFAYLALNDDNAKEMVFIAKWMISFLMDNEMKNDIDQQQEKQLMEYQRLCAVGIGNIGRSDDTVKNINEMGGCFALHSLLLNHRKRNLNNNNDNDNGGSSATDTIFVGNICFAINNLTRCKSTRRMLVMKDEGLFLETLYSLLTDYPQNDVILHYACSSISNLCDMTGENNLETMEKDPFTLILMEKFLKYGLPSIMRIVKSNDKPRVRYSAISILCKLIGNSINVQKLDTIIVNDNNNFPTSFLAELRSDSDFKNALMRHASDAKDPKIIQQANSLISILFPK